MTDKRSERMLEELVKLPGNSESRSIPSRHPIILSDLQSLPLNPALTLDRLLRRLSFPLAEMGIREPRYHPLRFLRLYPPKTRDSQFASVSLAELPLPFHPGQAGSVTDRQKINHSRYMVSGTYRLFTEYRQQSLERNLQSGRNQVSPSYVLCYRREGL